MLEILGVADAELVLDAAEALVEHDPKAALLAVERLSASGRDFTQFMRDLAAHLRHLFVVQTLGEVPETFAVTAEHTDRLHAQAERLCPGRGAARDRPARRPRIAAVKDGSDPRIQLELALLKATQPQADLSLQALMFRGSSSSSGGQPPRGPSPTPPDGRAGAPAGPSAAPSPRGRARLRERAARAPAAAAAAARRRVAEPERSRSPSGRAAARARAAAAALARGGGRRARGERDGRRALLGEARPDRRWRASA